MLLNKIFSAGKQRHHYYFHMYLKKEKKKVTENLNSRVYPNSEFLDYELLSILGQGSFSRVFAARNILNDQIFAVKTIKKQKINEETLKHLLSEIRILNSINFEFLISLECYFTNHCAVFVVMPLVKGVQFFKLLRKMHYFEENAAMFFAGQLVLALEYLQFMGIVFRDLKPENILIDSKGYLKLIDFGFAKHIDHAYTYTLCGTPEYMAPEVVMGKGYNLSPDWWSFGILIYEMCNSTPPFTSRNHFALYEKIMSGDIKWPRHFSLELKSLLKGLLEVKINKRLGCQRNKAKDVKFHKWFNSIDWLALLNKKIIPPISLKNIEEKNDVSVQNLNNYFKSCDTFLAFKKRSIDISV